MIYLLIIIIVIDNKHKGDTHEDQEKRPSFIHTAAIY